MGSSLQIACASTYKLSSDDDAALYDNENGESWSGRVYSRSKIFVKAEIVLDSSIQTALEELYIPLVDLELMVGDNTKSSKRYCSFEI
jgi:hypothetical protein